MAAQNDRTSLVRVEDLVVRYGADLILNDVSFSVAQGEILAILGGSGAGKSTLMRHMIGLENPDEGHVYIGDTDITQTSEARFMQTLKKVGVLFQGNALIGSMTIGENIALPIREFTRLPREAITAIVRMKLSIVDLDGYEDYLPSEISGGMKKRAGLARALALNPDILFLDEPSAGLDPVIAAEIDDLIVHINSTFGTTIILVTHDLDSIFSVAQRAILLDKSAKGIIAVGSPSWMRNESPDAAVRRFFERKSRSGSEKPAESGVTKPD